MSFIDESMIKDIGNFPHKRGSYEIENYLFGSDGAVNAGCWIYDKTVYGDMRLGPQDWKGPVYSIFTRCITYMPIA
ncbi:hypothetical protein KSS94_21600 [Pseudomonas fakonensis]|uniref:Uncharacterized protein n=1 Tax=Pseudomonas fakonensis TaxID=2842355 RepID=A0ABX8N2H4_9PSED|nr:hypothetical protein [Pseudomonas fakonensis]QXH50514.1 hypothetical protein KSS94_21600 [Pseudomonas fakonensis]